MSFSNSKTSSELKEIALEKLRGNWLKAVVVLILFTIITNGLNFTVTTNGIFRNGFRGLANESTRVNYGKLLNLIFGGPMSLGLSAYFLNLFRYGYSSVEDVFSGFKDFGKSFLLNFLMGIFIFLWTLLLIIPGIIAMMRYSMSFYIMHDNPHFTALEALDRSKEMMEGELGRLFMLWLSFLGWFILGLISLGIGFIWITPYYKATLTAFYEDLKATSGM
ncbi:DUF975 family protein [Desnuesiella massiliensis]|uniref:DUF975 family protein n=1 Tax=Desnuesiella massiliensis TaxID=1650662 RepID=UPI0006E39A2C|nr:DUF975 family protein [Desnuesiella massiliensis]